MISIKNVTKSFGAKTVLENISLEIPKGKSFTLIGPSGCGKSTLLRIVMGLINADAGSVTINDEEISRDNILKIRQNIGYVIQKGGLFPHLSAHKNVALAAEFVGWSESKIKHRISELAELVSIDEELLSRKPDQLSGGQAQRISLIRALMLDPDFILMDEPLGSIDPLVRYDLQTDLKQIFQSLHKTVLLVTHDLGEAAFLGDEIVLMKDGKIIQQDSIQQIMKNPKTLFVEQFVKAQRSPLSQFE